MLELFGARQHLEQVSLLGGVERRLIEVGYDIACTGDSFGANARVTTPVPAAVSKMALGDMDAARRAISAAYGSKINGTI